MYKGKRKRRMLPLPAALFLDLCGAGLLILAVYAAVYLMPVASASQPPALHTANQTTTPSVTWKDKFAAQFTDTVVATDHSYTSPNLSVTVSEHSIGSGSSRAVYYLADVYMADPSCFQTYFAGGAYQSGRQELLTDMGKKLGAVLAINGDSYCFNHKNTNGMLIRNGTVYRTNRAISDIGVLYTDGTFQTYPAAQFDAQQVMQNDAVQTWVFGPRLLDENGQIPSAYNTWDYIRKRHPRTAIGYFEPGHYCFLVADGRQPDYSNGMTLPELSQVFYDLGCRAAYNLDGGHTSGLDFRDAFVNRPYRAGKKISDCIYICEPTGREHT